MILHGSTVFHSAIDKMTLLACNTSTLSKL